MGDVAVAHNRDSPGAAVKAAELVFRSVSLPYTEPDTVELARAAVDHLTGLFNDLPEAISEALDAAGSSANLLSGDRLQGLSEIVQNADDVGATEVQLLLRRGELLAAHNGAAITLRNVLALATPWLTTKRGEARSVGRFGIGLMTLRSLSRIVEVHCPPYHVRLGDPSVTAVAPFLAPQGMGGDGWTVFRVPLNEGVLSADDLKSWLTRWGDSALLFLRHVARIIRFTPNLGIENQLSLRWDHEHDNTDKMGGSVEVTRRRARAKDGRTWMVYSLEAPVPKGVTRTYKAVDATTPIAVALPLQPSDNGGLYAGLPLTGIRAPIRANAQFDPLANRQGLASTPWNEALLPLVVDLWEFAVLDLFSTNPRIAWPLVPLPSPRGSAVPTPVDVLEDLLLERARHEIAGRLTFDVPGIGEVPLSRLAVEVPRLERVLGTDQVARLAKLPGALPLRVRDREGHWRRVLEDWRGSGASLPDPVSVADALGLYLDDTLKPETMIALAAAAIDSGLADELPNLPCVVTDDDRRLPPPAGDAEFVLVSEPAPLAEKLGIAAGLHAAHRKHSRDARVFLSWLRDYGALLDAADPAAVIRRLAAAGDAGRSLTEPLTDGQARALRGAFEAIRLAERSSLGLGVGRAVLLHGYSYDKRGRKTPTVTKVAAAYLPKSIEREPGGFADAAAKTPGLTWLQGRYTNVLRSPAGRSGLGALRFLRLMGAETAPRIRPHPGQQRRYVDQRLGLRADALGNAKARQSALAFLGATHTLDDYDSPDLQAVIANIAGERSVHRRRRRALALLSSLSRSWDRLGEFAEVAAAQAYMAWNTRGSVHSYWLWQAGDVAWLDDAEGVPRRPSDLRLKTSATIALYGADAPGYLRPEFHASNRRVLEALGVSGEPTTTELIDRLRRLRDQNRADPENEGDVHTEAAVVYKALTERVKARARGVGEMTPEQIRDIFSRSPGLIYTRLGWRTPAATLSGPPIFGDWRAFVPAVTETDALWRVLGVPEPSVRDCANVLGEMARERKEPAGTDVAIMLETLLLLLRRLSTAAREPSLARRLRRLPLWTSEGWIRERPVYAVDDPSLRDSLTGHVPLWQPGGDLDQFRGLFLPLRIEEIRPEDTMVMEPDEATYDEDSTALLREAIRLLRDDLSRNDQVAAASLSLHWEQLGSFTVRVHRNLSVRITGKLANELSDAIAISAKADGARRVLFVRSVDIVPRVDGGGHAIAGLFRTEHRRVSHAWRAAWDEAESGRQADALVLASERAAEQEAQIAADIEARTEAFRVHVVTRQRGRFNRDAVRPKRNGTTAVDRTRIETNPEPRMLVDPHTLRLRHPEGRVVGAVDAKPPDDRSTKEAQRPTLAEPRRGALPPLHHAEPAGYTALQKEDIALDLVRKILGGDAERVADLRAQRGVGADAIDEMDQFYELKVSAGIEPDRITLSASELRRALSDPNFFLVVVSGLEGTKATPRVRVIVNPLHQLQITDDGSITLAGVRNAFSVVFDFEHIPGDEV